MKEKLSFKRIVIALIALIILVFLFRVLILNQESFKKFEDVYFTIRHNHIYDASMKQLVKGAVTGMLDTLDEHSSYLTSEEYSDMSMSFNNKFVGVGIVITTKENKLTVVSPIENSPGEKAGIKSGDIITHVDDYPTKKLTQTESVNKIRGERETKVELTINRDGEKKKTIIIRDEIDVNNVDYEMETEKIGYISITNFTKSTGINVRNSLVELENAEGIILDLRNNPGGLLDESITVASNFIEEGTIVTVKSNKETTNRNKIKNYDFIDKPLVVLVNSGSGSAAEIVAGAIKDHETGILVGETTFGKGTVQSIIPMEDGSAIKLTTAKYLTPDGFDINKKGIEPDIHIEQNFESIKDEQLEKAIKVLKNKLHK